MNLKRIAARGLWIVGLVVHQLCDWGGALARAALRLAHRIDPSLEKFW